MFNLKAFQGKNVFITGHTGFKGSWLCKILLNSGANVTGYALNPPTEPSIFTLLDIDRHVHSVTGDIRNLEILQKAFTQAQPEYVFHLAAQPIVRVGYQMPVETYETNVMGTVHILDCVRMASCVKSVVNVTTDKVYYNRNWEWGYRENEALDGFDPYSNSKSCSELITGCYRNSFFKAQGVAVSTVRAGNVIGGGDFAKDRIVPDCVRAAIAGERIQLRNPNAIRPYQHVLEALYAYLLVALAQHEAQELADAYNVGPNMEECLTTLQLVEQFSQNWPTGLLWEGNHSAEPHEDQLLKLDCTKIKQTLKWESRWNIATAIEQAVQWYHCWSTGGNINALMDAQIAEFFNTL